LTEPSIENIRDQIRRLDVELVTLAARRVELARQVGELKRRKKLPTIDYAQEKAVLERARATAGEHGLYPAVAEDLVALLIRASVIAQDEDSVRVSATGAGKAAVVVGGAGRMGRWLVRFLSEQGYTTGALDPAASPEENAWARQAVADADLVVCAAPPAAIADLYRQWAARPPRGVIADIASIKTPLLDPIQELRRNGARIASLHPMFGPSTVLLRDADVVVCETGDAEATAAVERLFQPTTARLVRLPLADHDRVMADLLSLAHASAIAFALALPGAGHSVRSTTFQSLERVAARTLRESPDVYYEIQARNPHSAAALERLRAALDRIVSAAAVPDAAAFRALFDEGRRRAPGTEERSGGSQDP
jgi:chorismate mutase/prephenate dehydrogenase